MVPCLEGGCMSLLPEDIDTTVITNYCIVYAKQYICVDKLKHNNKTTNFMVDIQVYMSQKPQIHAKGGRKNIHQKLSIIQAWQSLYYI